MEEKKYQFGTNLEFKKALSNKTYFATLFAEGSESLKELLLYCFNNNIVVNSCCCGHFDNYSYNHKIGYVNFDVTNNNDAVINSVINSIYYNPDVNFEFIKLFYDKKIHLLIKIINPFSDTDIYATILNDIKIQNGIIMKQEDIRIILKVLKEHNYYNFDIKIEKRTQCKNEPFLLMADYNYDQERKNVLTVLKSLSCEEIRQLPIILDNEIKQKKLTLFKE
jgi:hypothetical protein